MMFVLEVTPVHLAYLFLGGFAVAFSLLSVTLKDKLHLGEASLGTAFGVMIGPFVAKFFDPRSWATESNAITLEVLRVTLAMGIFAIGANLPSAYLATHAKSLLFMVVPAMVFGWVASAGLIKALFPALSFISALVISSCLTPTDSILTSAIIESRYIAKNVPGRIRQFLSAESAANDGLAYPFLSLSMYLIVENRTGVAIEKSILIGWLYQTVLGVILGAVIGWLFSRIVRNTYNNGLAEEQSFVMQYVTLAIFAVGAAHTLGLNDLLAAFAAGTAVSWDDHFTSHTTGQSFARVIALLLNSACFIYVGAWLPFTSFASFATPHHISLINPDLSLSRLVILSLSILLVRRIPFLLAVYKWLTPDIKNWREALFCGHFGPMGVGALYIATFAVKMLPAPKDPPHSEQEVLAAVIQPIIAFVVLASILAHTLSIPVFALWHQVVPQFRMACSRTSGHAETSPGRTTTAQPISLPSQAT